MMDIDYNIEYGEYFIKSDNGKELQSLRDWLIENEPYKGSFCFVGIYLFPENERIYFKDTEYEMAFKLRWS